MNFFKLLIIVTLSLLVPFYPFLLIVLLAFLYVFRKEHKYKVFIISALLGLSIGFWMRFFVLPLDKESVALVIKRGKSYALIWTLRGRYYVSTKYSQLEVGDVIRISGNARLIDFAVVEHGFDFNKYLQRKGVFYEVTNPTIKPLVSFPIKKSLLQEKIINKYDVNARTLISSLIFNTKDYESELISSFDQLDLLVLLSTSGIHIHFFSVILEKILEVFVSEKKASIIASAVLVPLFGINLDRFIFYKLYLMKILRYFNKKKWGCKYDYLSLLSISTLLFLVINPFLIFNSSFYLSYGLSFYLYFARPLIRKFKKGKAYFINYGLIYVFFIPVRMFNTNGIMLFGPLIQLVFTPIISLYFVCAYVGLLTLGGGNLILNPFANFIDDLIKDLSYIDLSLHAKDIGFFLIIVLIVTATLFFYAKEVQHRPLLHLTYISLLLIGFYTIAPYERLYEESVTFINVGQGDATLIIKKNLSILIDTGGSKYQDLATECLIPFLKSKKIYQLDAVIITHDDYDHSGALPSLDKNFKVKKILSEKEAFPCQIKGFLVENLNHSEEAVDNNDTSLVLKFSILEKTWLIMGDASKRIEIDIMNTYPNLDVDYIKLGHHGSNTSSDEEFLRKISPKEAIISVGKNNYYGHPHQSVLDTLDKLNIRVRRTDLEGSIIYQTV